MSRTLSPGEGYQYRHGLQNEAAYNSRTYIGQVASVDTKTGVMQIRIGSAGKLVSALVPLVGLSANGATSSWIRYMPRPNDFVKVAFGPDNRPQCVGMTAWGHEEDTLTDDARRNTSHGHFIGGYARLRNLADKGVPGLRDFAELHYGEWDMRSSGNAYLKGNRQGTLLLAGGQAQFELVKNTYEINAQAGRFTIEDGGTYMYLGDTKRALTTGPATHTTPAGKALEIDVKAQLTPAPAETYQTYYRSRIGDVRDSSGLYEVGPHGAPLRVKQVAYSGAPATEIEQYQFTVDALGNVGMTLGVTALMHTQSGPICNWETSYLRTHITSTTTSTVAATGAVFLGTEFSINPLLKSVIYRPAEDLMLTTLATQSTAMAAAWSAFAVATTAAAAAIATPPTNSSPALLATAIAAWMSSFSAFMSTIAGAQAATTAGVTTFVGGAASYLSTKVFTE